MNKYENKYKPAESDALAQAHNKGWSDRIQGNPKNPACVKKNLRKAYLYGWNSGR